MLSEEQIKEIYKYVLLSDGRRDKMQSILLAIPNKYPEMNEEDVNILYNLLLGFTDEIEAILYLDTFSELYFKKLKTPTISTLIPFTPNKVTVHTFNVQELYQRYTTIKRHDLVRSKDGLEAYRLLVTTILQSNVFEEELPEEEITNIFRVPSLTRGTLNSNYIISNDGYGNVKLKMTYAMGSIYLVIYDEECGVIGCLDKKNVSYEVALEDVTSICVNSRIYRVKPDLFNAPKPTRVPLDDDTPFVSTATFGLDSILKGKNIL